MTIFLAYIEGKGLVQIYENGMQLVFLPGKPLCHFCLPTNSPQNSHAKIDTFCIRRQFKPAVIFLSFKLFYLSLWQP